MRHLLVFVGKRVASTLASTGSVDGSAGPPPDVKGKGKAKASSSSASRTKDGEIIAAEVMEDVLRMLVKAKVDTNPQSSGSQVRSFPFVLVERSKLTSVSPTSALFSSEEANATSPWKRSEPEGRGRGRTVHQEVSFPSLSSCPSPLLITLDADHPSFVFSLPPGAVPKRLFGQQPSSQRTLFKLEPAARSSRRSPLRTGQTRCWTT